MERYKIHIHNDIEVNLSGKIRSKVGHSYVQFEAEGIDEFFGKNPVKENMPFSTGIITSKDEADRYAASKKHPNASKLVSKTIYVTKEEFFKAYNYALAQQAHSENYIGVYNDCIDFTQAVYKAAGLKGHFAQLYTAEELSAFKSGATFSFIYLFIPMLVVMLIKLE